MWRETRGAGLAAAVAVMAAWSDLPAGAVAYPSAAEIIAKIGPVVITAGEFEWRLKTLSDARSEALGRTPDEVKRNFLERVVVPEVLFTLGATARKLDDRPLVQSRIQDLLRTASVRDAQADARRSGVTPADLAGYYEENEERFHTPERLYVWRILSATRKDAVDVLDEFKKVPTVERWQELARARSIDERTAARGGNVGLIDPEGEGMEESPRVDPSLYAAASTVKDGEIVEDPVAEGDAFAVVWRKGSVPPVDRTPPKKGEGALAQVLLGVKVEQAVKNLVQRLRGATRVEEYAEFLDLIEVDSSGNVDARRRPALVSHRPADHARTKRAPRNRP